MSHEPRHTILLIEADASLRRLITLGLHYRGIQVIEASSPTLFSAFPAKQVELLVLDVNSGAHSNWSLLTAIQSDPSFSSLPIVVLSWEAVAAEDIQHQGGGKLTLLQATWLTKPFDARTLHAIIEQLLAETAPQQADTALKAQEVLLIAQATSPTLSIWPIVAAAALLLAFIGLLVQITITAVGALLFLVALLWWTLGGESEAASVSNTQLSESIS